MTKIIFIFIGAFFISLSLFSGGLELNGAEQMIICLSLISLLGIPHGAIDNVLFLRQHNVSPFRFYFVYLTTIGANVLLWVFFPMVSFIIFILISSYHFGQSQYAHRFNIESKLDRLLYFAWGLAVLSGLIYFNGLEIANLTNTVYEFGIFDYAVYESVISCAFIVSLSLSLVLFAYYMYTQTFRLEVFLIEAFTLGLIFLGFYVFPLLVGFTLYFVILHSMKVLQEEYTFVKTQNIIGSVTSFIKLLAPYTLISIGGIILLFGAIYIDLIQISYAYCILILISSITVPHAYVMERFYSR